MSASATERCAPAGLARLPRIELVRAPTPLHPAPALSRELGVPVLFKRDDLTGVGLGGNKVRALEYLLADALEQGCDSLVTGAGPQSNWAMLAALTALRSGLEPFLVCYGPPVPSRGNLLLERRLGVDVSFTHDPERSSVDSGIAELAERLRRAGRRPYVLPRGGATPLGSVGYLRASEELATQLPGAGDSPTTVWLPTGSCGTHAGLAAGAAWLGAPYQVVGVTVSRPAPECRQRIHDLAVGAADVAGVGPVRPEVIVLDGWIGPGYGKPSRESWQAAQFVARTEGVFLDPVFGAKAMAALMAECRAGRIAGPVVFLVTGGAPTLFAEEARV